MLKVHPGEVLVDELEERGMSASALAKALHVPASRISRILSGKRGITADTALRLSMFFGTTPQFWMNLQTNYDLAVASRKTLPKIKPVKAA